MNLIVGGGVIGLPYAAANFGYMGFVFAISSVLCVAMTTQYFNLCAAEKLNQIDPYIIPGYEELGYYASGKRRWGEFYFELYKNRAEQENDGCCMKRIKTERACQKGLLPDPVLKDSFDRFYIMSKFSQFLSIKHVFFVAIL